MPVHIKGRAFHFSNGSWLCSRMGKSFINEFVTRYFRLSHVACFLHVKDYTGLVVFISFVTWSRGQDGARYIGEVGI